MGIRDKPIAPASGFAERLIGSIRRESVDHMIVLGEAHLRRILKSYARYYNKIKTHRSLNKDAPVSRSVQRTGAERRKRCRDAARHAEASPGSTASGQNTSSENPSEISAASPAGRDYPVRLSTSGPRAPKSPKPHHRSHQKLSPLVNLPSARLKRPRMTPLTQRSFASFCNGEPRACRALPQLLGKTQPRAIIV